MPRRGLVMPRRVALLGSTGSVGRQTLEVVRSSRGEIVITALAAGSNIDLMQRQIEEFHPTAVSTAACAPELSTEIDLFHGETGAAELVIRDDVDLVVVATSGRTGLLPTLAALEAGKLVALANKETLVMAGSIIRERFDVDNQLVPIDSEHSAIWQCLQGEPHSSIERLTLTASGGALRNLAPADLENVTPETALRHPNWSMGRKVTIDSANLMNKGLEVIEAKWLFGIDVDRIEVVMHAESIIHSLVTFHDGSTKAQLGVPDMRLPIQYGLSHPNRWPNDIPRVDLANLGTLHFAAMDLTRYPALKLALEAARLGGTYPAVLSAADEIAVQAFLDCRIRFTEIPEIVERSLGAHIDHATAYLEDILESDRWAREYAERAVAAC